MRVRLYFCSGCGIMGVMEIKKAIISVAGWGTRRLPITKVIEKAMLPIGNRPIVDYIVEDCARAGLRELYIVTDEKPESQVRAYYENNPALARYLIARGKEDRMELLDTRPGGVMMHFWGQKDIDKKYGTAAPVAQVVEQYGINETCVVLSGDDFIWSAEGKSDMGELVRTLGAGESGLLGVEVPKEDVSRYGVLEVEGDKLVGLVEKPKTEEAPSNLINVSKYVMSAELLQMVVEYCRDNHFGPRDQEYMITDPIFEYVKRGGVMRVRKAEGTYLDGGSVEGWMRANEVVLGGEKKPA